MHIVVAGEDELAIRVTEALMVQHDVVLIVNAPALASRVDRLDAQIIQGNANSAAVLREARIEKADFFIAASSNDERNIVHCVTAEHAGAKRAVCIIHNVSDPQVMALDDHSLSEAVGIDLIVRPAEQLINEILHVITVPGALNAKTLLDGRFEVVKSVIEPGAAITAADFAHVKLPRGVRIVLAERDGKVFVPEATTTFMPGDRVTTIGAKRRLGRFIQRVFRGGHHQEKRRAMVCGGGSVGVGVANGLREAGWMVKIIEQDRKRCEELSELCESLVLHGDASDIDLLQEEHIESVTALVAVTNNDEKNLLISLVAKHLGVPRIITRTDRGINERIFEKVGIDVVLSARGAAVRTIVSEIVNADTTHIAELYHGEVGILDFELPPTFERRRVADLFSTPIASLGGVVRRRRARVPRDNEHLEAGDHVLVVCLAKHEEIVRAYLCEDKPLPLVLD